MKKGGSILFELLISTMIAAFLSIMLITNWHQAGRLSTAIEKKIDLNMRIGLLHDQLSTDIAGVVVPSMTPVPKKNSSEKESGGSVDKSVAKNQTETSSPSSHKSTSKKPSLFEGTVNDGQCERLSFISTNRIPFYIPDQKSVAHSRLMKVTYSLEQDKHHPGSFILYRNVDDIYVKKEGKEQSSTHNRYPLISGLKSLKISYMSIENKKNSDQKKGATDRYAVHAVWPPQKSSTGQVSEQKTSDQEPLPVLPHAIEVTGAVFDRTYKRDIPFSFVYTIMTTASISTGIEKVNKDVGLNKQSSGEERRVDGKLP